MGDEVTKHLQTFDDLCTCGMPWPCFAGHSMPCAAPDPGMVTITISREDAAYMAEGEWVDERLGRIATACRSAVER